MKYSQIKQNQAAFLRDQIEQKPRCVDFIPHKWNYDLTLNLDHNEKRRHYWLFSEEPDHGKTKFQQALEDRFICSRVNPEQNFYEVKEATQFILIDEYSTK